MRRLWEVVHPYYCNEGSYFSDDCGQHVKSWQDFVAAEGDADKDYNLLFRWDWEAPRPGESGDYDSECPIRWVGDENYRDCELKLFYMGQRKGVYRYVIVEVCRADEPAVKVWLQERFDYMLRLWEPFSLPSGAERDLNVTSPEQPK